MISSIEVAISSFDFPSLPSGMLRFGALGKKPQLGNETEMAILGVESEGVPRP
jgi:hypothetical protein